MAITNRHKIERLAKWVGAVKWPKGVHVTNLTEHTLYYRMSTLEGYSPCRLVLLPGVYHYLFSPFTNLLNAWWLLEGWNSPRSKITLMPLLAEKSAIEAAVVICECIGVSNGLWNNLGLGQ